MQGELTPDQFQKVLKLCDMLALQDFSVAALLLKQANWSIQKTLGLQENYHQPNNYSHNQPTTHNNSNSNVANPSQPAKKQNQNLLPKPAQQFYPKQQYENFVNSKIQDQNEDFNYDYQQYNNQDEGNQFQQQYQYYEKQLDKQQRLEQKRRKFNEGFPMVPLQMIKIKSEIRTNGNSNTNISENRLIQQQQVRSENSINIQQNHNSNAFDFEGSNLQKAHILCENILSYAKNDQVKKYRQSLKKTENNKNFLKYLHKKYQSKINFTFGTFLLNLARSYMDKKYLLVYIHKSQFQNNKSIKMLLNQKEIATFINKNCTTYGMFDSSDDYQVLHKYVPMKNLPAFALFKFNKKELKEQFISQYPILQSEPQSFIEWIANNIGVVLKKKQILPQKMSEQQRAKLSYMSNIIYEQNFQYEQMAKMYQLKRNKSKARKQSIQAMQLQIEVMKQSFKQQPSMEAGKTLQVRFRLPFSGNSIMRVFKNNQKILRLFEYIHCFGRDQFEQRFANFDLTQTFPQLSLNDKKQQLISEIFEGSQRQNIIVKQL